MQGRSLYNLATVCLGYGRWIVMLAGVISMGSCGNVALLFIGGSGSKITGLSAASNGASFSSRCGAKASDLSDPSFRIIDKTLLATILASGEKSGITYDATLLATIKIVASSRQSTNVTLVEVTKLRADDDGRFSKAEVDATVAKQSKTTTSLSMGTGRLLILQKTDPAFLGIECTVGFTATSTIENSEGTGIVVFEPGAALSLSPLASLEAYASELGDSRSFSSVATVRAQGKDWAAAGAEATITTTFTKVSPDISKTKGVPAGSQALDADLAYEVTTTANGLDVTTFGLSKRQVFFINTTNHQLVAVLDDSGRLDPVSKKPLAPVLAIVQ